MRSKIIASLVAGGLLVGAGFVTSIVSVPTTASAQEDTVDSEDKGLFTRGLEFLSEVLDELVGEGTIEQSDADAVLDAVSEKAEEVKEEREAIHDAIKAALEDGALTEQEALDAGVPDDHWLFTAEALEEAWEDGQLTGEEIREARPHPRRDAFRKGAHLGALLDDGGIDQDEYEALGDDHPLKEADVSEYFEDDGLITVDELRELKDQLRSGTDDTDA
jgi:polyhydroxyalkanoate synthesis regulator phasin